MALVLSGFGLFLHLQLRAELNDSIEQSLAARAGEVSALARDADPGLAHREPSLIEDEESFAQLLTPSGQVYDSTPQLKNRPVLSPAETRQALERRIVLEHESLRGLEGRVKILATPVRTEDEPLVAVVGSSLDDRDEALRELAALLLVGGPAALLLASLAGYGAASAALRAVELMRRQAAAISASEPAERLPVPATRDEISRLATTLNEMLDRLETALRHERRFVDDASHELRTPLALHRTELETALRYGEGEEELRRAIESAIEEVDHLSQLAESLLVVARSDEGRLAIQLERLAAADLMRTAAARFGGRAEALGRAVTVDDDGGIVVEGDRLRLEQALTAMVDNALRYGAGEVRLSARPGTSGVELHVTDQGPGFPEDFLPRAFERFSRGDGKDHGSGLGLAIVDTIARAHRGRAAAANRPGGGADVWIEL